MKEKELKKIKEEGHTIGLHSASHNYAYIYRSENDFLWDLYELQDFVYQVTGEYSHYIRFPGGSKNKVSDEVNYGIMDKLRPLVEDLGFEYYDWHVATGDSSEFATKEHILSSVERGLINDYDELIILMHDLHPITVDVIDDLVKLCKEHGYRFDKITDETIPFHAVGVS
ncbi:MAG: polysaccharide deacetylase family protein [Lachnospiraceae bacterium]|nr:polysaccharide deacetylase family protein [Lachnospiraceae bacterium]